LLSTRISLTLAHSPDPDDVYMWWPITGLIKPPADAQAVRPAIVYSPPEIETDGIQFIPIAADIAALNRRAAAKGDLDITALSVFAWARLSDRYALTAFGSSFGEGYGPKVVCRGDVAGDVAGIAGQGALVAVPGTGTTAFLLLSMLAGPGRFKMLEMPFDRILEAVSTGERGVTHGLLIHQSQLTYAELGLRLVVDLGQWWGEQTGLPLPLGGNAIRRDLDERFGAGTLQRVVDVMAASVRHARANHARSSAYCRAFAPELSAAQTERYLEMYVSGLTLDAGQRGEGAISRIVEQASRLGLAPGVREEHLRMLRPRNAD